MKWLVMVIAALMLFLFMMAPVFGAAAPPGAQISEIMRQVAARQDEAREMRAAFIYQQDVLMRFHRGNGKLAREEERRYTVAPNAKSSSKTLVSFKGQYEKDGKLVAYDTPGYNYKDVDIDGELIDSLTDSLVNEDHSRDGISADLFPLTSKAQPYYVFTLHGREIYRGHEVFKISFKPRRGNHEEWEDGLWEGELLVEAREYQPVLISTRMAKGLPVVVRTLLGTNLKGLGFKLDYEQVADGVWFPVRYGGEFELKAVFFYKRRISVGLRSYDFKRTEVSTRIEYQPPAIPPH